jgi:hypothetical protein
VTQNKILEKSNAEGTRGKGILTSLSRLKTAINFKEDFCACVLLEGTQKYKQPKLNTTIMGHD